jgi:hypothetical protein
MKTRKERMEAEAANRKAFNDLKAYEDCMASSCGRPSSGGGGGDDDDDDHPGYAPGYSPANPGGDEPGTPF